MRIEILGMGCPKCKKLYENAQAAVRELSIQAEIVKVEDMQKIIDYGVMLTPALVVEGNVVVSGKVLSPQEIKKILNG